MLHRGIGFIALTFLPITDAFQNKDGPLGSSKDSGPQEIVRKTNPIEATVNELLPRDNTPFPVLLSGDRLNALTIQRER